MNTNVIEIKDKLTGQKFRVSPTATTAHIVTKDGVRVRVHPHIIKLLMKPGAEFDGQTLMGLRPMVKL